ncbi:MAG: hypothetical protein A3F14_03225 [Gammaproteobacteria bacterium RIFCSPHIGHO2_12_FULL_43_28]|nr:MAG: hypothetical protein A3F14_03225 [Gammaproteobacteria bacterium RIFCSPHIGHO2_12_FULL_43_28]
MTLPSGLHLSYAEIITLGDFYQVPEKPIYQGATNEEKEVRFLADFNLFAVSEENVSEATGVIEIIYDELKSIDEAIANGEDAEAAYKRVSPDYNRRYNCATGGGCSASNWWLSPGKYLKVAKTNYDHFGDNAWVSYHVGHRLAIQAAVSARQTEDVNKLAYAYAINAYASHFLSDRFASGHIRTPRVELAEQVTPQDVGSLLANYMHDEESSGGLHVHNGRGEQWIAYGDTTSFEAKCAPHRAKLIEALQLSADEIYLAYATGKSPDSKAVENILPIADEIGSHAKDDISSLFFFEPTLKQVMRREKLDDFYDRHWTSNWWGWSTFTELERKRGLPLKASRS